MSNEHSLWYKGITSYSNHETVIRTGIICKKIFGTMRNLACEQRIVENAKIFGSFVKHF